MSQIRKELLLASPLKILSRQKKFIFQRRQLLDALSPLNLLNRGFCIVHDSQNKPIRTIKDIKINDSLMIQFSDGTAGTVVESITTQKE